jgi:hypothetical protein
MSTVRSREPQFKALEPGAQSWRVRLAAHDAPRGTGARRERCGRSLRSAPPNGLFPLRRAVRLRER